jgi:hypothetical protein
LPQRSQFFVIQFIQSFDAVCRIRVTLLGCNEAQINEANKYINFRYRDVIVMKQEDRERIIKKRSAAVSALNLILLDQLIQSSAAWDCWCE